MQWMKAWGRVCVVLAVLLFGVNIFLAQGVVGCVALVLWIVGALYCVQRWEVFGAYFFSRMLFGGIALFSVGAFIFFLEFFFTGMFPWITWVGGALGSCALLLVPLGNKALVRIERAYDQGALWLGLAVFVDVLILALLIAARTDGAVISPWNFFSGELFFLFFVATALFLYGASLRKDDTVIFVAFLHTFVALSVSSIVIATGFGFDPFIHRAAEQALTSFGSIEPKRILYSGQYALIVGLHQLTALPLKQIDIWLVPLLASIFLPLSGYVGLFSGWSTSEKDAKMWWICMLALPFMLLTFTVPFTVTYVWFLGLLFFLPAARTSAMQISVLAGCAMCILFHPLLAFPTFIFSLGFFAYQRAGSPVKLWGAMGVMGLLLAISTPAMLAVYQISQGQGIMFGGMLTRVGGFVSLFHSPYTDPYPFIPWYLDALYDFRYIFPMVAFGAGVLAMYFLRKSSSHASIPYGVFIVGVLLSIFGTSTLFYFKDIIVHEQAEFSLRLLTAWYAIPLPFLAIFLSRVTRDDAKRYGVMMIMGVLVTHAWFFSYPQFNMKYPYFSPSVSSDDVAAVREIEAQGGGAPYLVLSNQMTSAAALQEFGFSRYVPLDGENVLWYAIPTGGVLYEYYTRTILEGPSDELLLQLHEKTGVKSIYFVTHAYWPWYEGFVQAMELTSDRSFSVHNGNVIIYEYTYE